MKRFLIIAALLLGAFMASPSAQSKFWVLVNGALRYNGPVQVGSLLSLGGTTSSFPALRQVGNGVDVVTADLGAYTSTRGLSFNVQSGGNYNFNGTVIAVFTAPTISSGFGTSPAILSSNGTTSFRVNVGTGGVATTGVVGMPAATTGWNCQVTDMGPGAIDATRQTASTTSTVTVGASAAWAASDTLIFSCSGY